MNALEPIRTLVVDDEPHAREGVLGLLAGDPEVTVVGEARAGREAAELIARERPELVFLDVQMPGLDGFGVIEAVGAEQMPTAIFVTAYDEFAVRAFEVHALDYLLKPFSDERFGEALARGKQQVRQRRAGALGQQLAALLQHGGGATAAAAPGSAAPAEAAVPRDADAPAAGPLPAGASEHQPLGRVMVPTPQGMLFVPVEDIDWIEADDYYAKLHVGGRSYLIRQTMQHLEQLLDARRFTRVHRSAIVNIDRVQMLQPYFRGAHVLTLKDGTRLRLSRSRRAEFERATGWRL